MPKASIPFSAFVEAAGVEHTDFINSFHEYMTEQDCKAEIKEAANGYVVSYVHKPSKRTVANYVFRKEGLIMRMYADNVASYMEILEKWPDSMKEKVQKAGTCKRTLNPEECNARCIGSFDFILDGERRQPCRYNGLMFVLNDETKPYVRGMMEREIEARKNGLTEK